VVSYRVLIQWRQNQEKNGENFTMGNTSAGEKFSVDRVRRELRHFSPLKSLANYDNVAVVGETLTSIGNASRNSSHLDPQSTGLSQLPILPFCCLQLKMSNETLKTVKEYKIVNTLCIGLFLCRTFRMIRMEF
jgi:hypothetical protein